MRVSHNFSAEFDDDNLIATGGLVPVMLLAESAGLSDRVQEYVTVAGSAGANAPVKVAALVAGMVAGADSISDMDLLRHGGMGRAFTEHRAPTTLGTHLRGYRFGHVRQLDAIASRLLTALAARVPGLVGGADEVAYLDIDDTIRQTHGYAKQGAGYGYSGVKGLNALVSTLSTPTAAPVIAGMRLRRGSVKITVRADSAFYQHDVIAAVRRGKAHFSITARMDAGVVAAISRIGEQEWVGIKYPEAIWDEDEQRWISDAQVAEIPYTAFTSRKKADHVAARLIVRRVKRLNPASATAEQGELLAAYRHHAIFTDSPLSMLAAESAHRDHAIIEQVISDLKDGPLAHCPSGVFTANSAWAVLAAIAFNLTRAAGVLASRFYAKARTATIRAQLINVPARIANRARSWLMHMPRNWPWQQAWAALFDAASAPLPAAA
ncbi:transposase [Cellulosimicrobium cellulans]